MRSRALNVVAAVSVVKAVVASVASGRKVDVVMVVVSAANVVKAVRHVVTMHPRRAAMTQPVAVASVAMRNQRRPLA